ncbi:MAG: nuclear transport factor 2 family protein [bacterium]
MKRCPTCNKTFTDQNLSFCPEDGTPLLPLQPADDETTVVSSPAAASAQPAYVPRDWQTDYQPSGSSAPLVQKRKAWPWVVGILAVLFIGMIGIAIAAKLLLPGMLRAAANANRSNSNPQSPANENSNLNSAPLDNSNTNTNSTAEQSPADADKVLADLTTLEHEWTVANINADKPKLERILAEDYVGTAADGKSQGKADYLRTIERDTSIEKWDFEDLKLNLKGDRATLAGIIRLRIRGEEVAYHFTDKFVWRDGRWQAVSSAVVPAQQTPTGTEI